MNDFGMVPNINMFSNVQSAMPLEGFSRPGSLTGINEGGASFKDVLTGMVSNINNDVQKPDQMLNEYMAGNTNVDIHDVMTAIAKADLGVSMMTQMTSKVVTAYNAVMQISI